MTTQSKLWTVVCVVVLASCGEGSDADNPWWAVETNEGDGDDDGEDYDDDEDYDDEYDDEDEYFDEKLLWGELPAPGGTPANGVLGFFFVEGGEERCEVIYDAAVTPADGCDACTFAVTLTLSGGNAEIDDGSCATEGFLGRDGTVVEIGHAPPESAQVREDGTWSPAGFSELEDGNWYFEIEVP